MPQFSIYGHPLLLFALERYQESRSLDSRSEAAVELLVLGIERWLQEYDTPHPHWGETWDEHNALVAEFHQWEGQVLAESGWADLPDLTDEQANALSFERFIMLKVMPQNGGKRNIHPALNSTVVLLKNYQGHRAGTSGVVEARKRGNIALVAFANERVLVPYKFLRSEV